MTFSLPHATSNSHQNPFELLTRALLLEFPPTPKVDMSSYSSFHRETTRKQFIYNARHELEIKHFLAGEKVLHSLRSISTEGTLNSFREAAKLVHEVWQSSCDELKSLPNERDQLRLENGFTPQRWHELKVNGLQTLSGVLVNKFAHYYTNHASAEEISEYVLSALKGIKLDETKESKKFILEDSHKGSRIDVKPKDVERMVRLGYESMWHELEPTERSKSSRLTCFHSKNPSKLQKAVDRAIEALTRFYASREEKDKKAKKQAQASKKSETKVSQSFCNDELRKKIMSWGNPEDKGIPIVMEPPQRRLTPPNSINASKFFRVIIEGKKPVVRPPNHSSRRSESDKIKQLGDFQGLMSELQLHPLSKSSFTLNYLKDKCPDLPVKERQSLFASIDRVYRSTLKDHAHQLPEVRAPGYRSLGPFIAMRN